MKKQVQIQYVIEKLSYFCHYIKTNNRNSFTDINVLAEGFLMNLLNIVLRLDLQNLNEQQINYPGVDLGDLSAKTAFQVTSQRDSKKIIETYETVFKYYKGIRNCRRVKLFTQDIRRNEEKRIRNRVQMWRPKVQIDF